MPEFPTLMFDEEESGFRMKIRPNAKAWIAGLGTVTTAVTTFLATVSLAVGDDAITAEEVTSLTGAVVSLVGTIYGVWKVSNQPSE